MCTRLSLLFILSAITLIPCSIAADALKYNQAIVGFDGPAVEQPAVIIIESADALKQHWISTKFGKQKTRALIDGIDFSLQFIAVVQIGIRNTATGNLGIAEIEFKEPKGNLVIYIRVGVNELDCEVPKRRSFPYAIGIIDKPEVWPTVVNYAIRNFGDGCKGVLGTESFDI